MKKVVMTPNPYRDKNFKYVNTAERILKESGIDCKICLAFDVDKSFELPEDIVFHDLDKELSDAELLICFGGDGTLLHASKAATKRNLPVLGVNVGTMGFMSELEGSELELLRKLKNDDFTVEERMMLHVQVIHEGEIIYDDIALNDAAITKGTIARVISVAVLCDDVEAMNFGGDGVIICTPTGSTAYSLSAGGPIVEPVSQNIVITPICAHDMMTKPLVASPNRKIQVRIGRMGRKNAFLSVDGGRAVRLSPGDVVSVTKAEQITKLLRLKNRSFFEIISNKLR